MKMLQLVLILLVLSGVFTQDSKWDVKYPDKPICAVRGFSVAIKCSYYYPQGHQVKQKLWCSSNLNTYKCEDEYVYNSSLNTKSDFKFTGDDKSDCTLLIHNVQFSYSGVYRFRFITNVTGGKWTGEPGVTLQVTDLKVSLIRLSGNGTLKQGDSLNLTCDVNCTHTSSQFVWTKNNQRLYTSGPVLHFPALILRDSGNYTCTWGTGDTSGSETISLHVEDLKVSLIRLSGNGTLKQGDSLNLTCDVSCTHTSSQFVWSKNNQRLYTSGPFLHFPALTLRDSGNYTCTWGTGETSGSETISLHVEDLTGENPEHQSVWVIVLVIIGVSVFVSVVSGAVIHNRRRKFTAPEENVGENGEKTRTKPQFSSQVSHVVEEEMLNNEEVIYSSVQLKTTKSSQLNRDPQPDKEVLDKGGDIYASVLKKPNKATKRCDHTEQQKNDSVIYSSVKMT
ncbi:B-cell receptor CD22-like [Tachysurus fulvidraco]|uniref:B-cell receptor CD22-like n=1 Tax=Tachysurus fulvidraco TaxID=1234273 RepID=UPI001FEF3A03|nr:B-cell receptor CD22-like [Tachysurus fulvidraco]